MNEGLFRRYADLIVGFADTFTVADSDRERANRSAIHVDFMIGGDDVAVTGITADGARIPVLHGGRWQLEAPADELRASTTRHGSSDTRPPQR